MSKYQVVFRPYSRDTSIDEKEFEDIDEAVRYAISLGMSDDFLIVTVVNWKAEVADAS